MSEEIEHPSFLVLDRLAVGASVPSHVRAHFETCTDCREHLQQVRQEWSVPEWAQELEREKSWPRSVRPWGWIGRLVGLGAAAAVLLLAVRGTEPRSKVPYT